MVSVRKASTGGRHGYQWKNYYSDFLLYQLMMEMGKEIGLISTVENRIGDKVLASTYYTLIR